MPFAPVDGARCYYRLAGREHSGAATVVFIHGSGGDGTVWGYQLAGLAGACRVIIPDLPAHGRSGGRRIDSVAEYSKWLQAFAETLRLSSFFLAGHSLGGAIAQQHAREMPGRVAGLVLAGAAMRFCVPREYALLLQQDFCAAAQVSCDRAYAGAVPEALYRRGYDMLVRNGAQTMAADMRACSDFDSTGWAGAIETPGVVICGAGDSITPPEDSRQLARSLRSCALHTVADAGHMVMIEQAETCNRIILDFISRQAKADTAAGRR
jgi:pimeloyl-ACP methyl ester carboxylesterase